MKTNHTEIGKQQFVWFNLHLQHLALKIIIHLLQTICLSFQGKCSGQWLLSAHNFNTQNSAYVKFVINFILPECQCLLLLE